MGTAKTATVHQGTTTEIARGVTATESTEVIEIETAEIAMEVAAEEAGGAVAMTDVSAIDTVAALGTMMTIRDVLPIMKMTGVVTTEVHAKMTTVSGMEVGEAVGMIWVRPEVNAVDEVAVGAAVGAEAEGGKRVRTG